MNRLKDRYDGVCPVCGTEIPDDVREGDECQGCSEVFLMPRTAEPLDPPGMDEYMERIEEELDNDKGL